MGKRKFTEGDDIIVKRGRLKNLQGKFKEYIQDYGYYTPYSKVKVYCLDGDIEIAEVYTSYLEKI